jgi:hypothetical protein
MTKVVRRGLAAIPMLFLFTLLGWAQVDSAPVVWGQEVELNSDVEQDGEALTEVPEQPELAIAPDGQVVLDYAPPVPELGESGVLAREILARPEFQREVSVPQESLLERIMRWLNSLPGLPTLGANNWLMLSLLAALLGLLTYLLVRLAWGGLGRRRKFNGTARSNGKRTGRLTDYMDEAEQAALRQDYRQAVRYRFLAMLQQAGLPDNQLLTNRQVQRQLTQRSTAVERPLVELITGYEDAWYGQLPCTADTYGGLRLWAEQVERLLEQEQAA